MVAALSSRAGLLLPDERTAGLDPLMAAAFRECASDERREDRAILLSSHLLAGPEASADPVTAIRSGKPAETGTPRAGLTFYTPGHHGGGPVPRPAASA